MRTAAQSEQPTPQSRHLKVVPSPRSFEAPTSPPEARETHFAEEDSLSFTALLREVLAENLSDGSVFPGTSEELRRRWEAAG